MVPDIRIDNSYFSLDENVFCVKIQEHRSRMYKHANRPVPLQNIRLNFTENPYHRVIRGNTYNLRTSTSGIIRLNSHLSTPQHEPRFQRQQQLHFHHHSQLPPPPQHQQVMHHATPVRQVPKRVGITVVLMRSGAASSVNVRLHVMQLQDPLPSGHCMGA